MSNIQKRQQKMVDLIESKKADIAQALGEKVDAGRFLKVAAKAIHSTPELAGCSPESLYTALLDSARLGLQPDGREAAIIPYRNEAQFQPMYQGLANLMTRSPGVTKVEARCVREGDEFDYSLGTENKISHKQTGDSDGRVTHAYCIVYWTDADPSIEVIDRKQIERARAQSNNPNSGPWKKWYGEMSRKTVLKRAAKYVDLSPEAHQAVQSAPSGGGEVEVEVEGGPTEELDKALTEHKKEEENKAVDDEPTPEMTTATQKLRELVNAESEDPKATLRNILLKCEKDMDKKPVEWERVPEKAADFLVNNPETRSEYIV